jgi:hypothetical protein
MSCLEALASSGAMLSKLWVQLAGPLRRSDEPGRRCQVCLQQTLMLSADVPVDRDAARALTICPNCGIVDDSRVGAPIVDFDLHDTEVSIHGALPGEWSAGLRVETFGKEETTWLPWGETDRFGLLPRCEIGTLPIGHAFVSAFLLSALGELRVLTRPTYRPGQPVRDRATDAVDASVLGVDDQFH